jgi:homoserine dehydrogenase
LDVARKLLILSREIGHKAEIDEFAVESLIPHELQNTSIDFFWKNIKLFDAYFDEIKTNQSPNHVLQYIGEFDGENHSARLVSIPDNSAFGQLKGTDLIFEIYTERYNSNPLIIQGAGAGAETTAIGVLGDVLKLGQLIKHKVR